MKKSILLFYLLLVISSCFGQQVPGSNVKLTKEERKEIIAKAKEKIEFITTSIVKLATQPGPESDAFKKREEKRKEKVVASILGNFANADSNTVEVTNKAGKSKTESTRKYFTNLSKLGRMYTTVEIEAYDQYVGDIKQVTPDSFVVIGQFCQRFTGYNANNEKGSYVDVTCKHITLHVKHEIEHETDEKGESTQRSRWLIKVGDITIDEKPQ